MMASPWDRELHFPSTSSEVDPLIPPTVATDNGQNAMFSEAQGEMNYGTDSTVNYPTIDIPTLGFENPSNSFPQARSVPPFANVEFLNLDENQLFFKVQCRKNGIAKQVLENAEIRMKVTYGPDDLFSIRGWVRRHPEAAKHMKIGTNVEIPLVDSSTNEFKNLIKTTQLDIVSQVPLLKSQEFSVNLGEIYDGPADPFKLERTDTTARNRFQIVIQLVFFQHLSRRFYSPTFRCRTRPNATGKRKPETPHPDVPSPKFVYSGPPSNETIDSGVSGLAAPDAIVENLEAKTAKIDDLVVRNSLVPPDKKADIAYYLAIGDPEVAEELEEGDVVGFFTDEYGETEIRRLVNKNIETAVHAGVISRSYYLAANKQSSDKGTKTDTVCVIGIVNVKVIGNVENGERIYVSVNYPGNAIPQSYLPVGSFLRKKHVLLGMALEKKTAKFMEDPHLVKCFLCIVLDVSRQDVLEEIEELYENTEMSTKIQIKVAQKKAWRRFQYCCAITFVFLVLLSFLLYQVLVPGSMFRYWLCRQGSISNHDVYFTYTPLSDTTRQFDVHGILFHFEKVLEKIPEKVPRNTRNDTGGVVYYYLNVDRCAFSGDRGQVGNHIGGFKSVGGGVILSIDKNCTKVYWYGHNDTLHIDGWYPYVSAIRLRCHPLPPYHL